MSSFMNDGYELGWDAEIENEGKEFVIAEPGDYNFTIVGFERGRFQGSAKMPPCNQAKLSVRLDIPGETGECIVKHNLFLHSKTEWKLCEFFTAIGQRKKGERVSMNWNSVMGATGRCKVTKRSFTSNTTGKEMFANDIEKFYEPDPNSGLPFYTNNLPQNSAPQNTAPASVGYTMGKF